MSASTGTRKERNVQTRSNESIIESDKALIDGFKTFAESSNPVAGLGGGAVNNSPKTPTGNYLAKEGDSINGPIALGPPADFTIEVDANNTIDIGSLNDNPQYSSNIQLDDLQPNSSVLDIIANAEFDGQILVLRTFAPTTAYTISQGTIGNGGNIQTGDSNDLTVGDLQTVVLIFDASLIINANTGGTWRVVSISNVTGGGGIAFPIDFPEEADRGTVTTTQTVTFTNSTRHSVAWTVGAPNVAMTMAGLTANTLQITSITVKQDATGGRTISFTDTVINASTIIAAFVASDPLAGISFIVERERGVLTAYLKTGNVVSGATEVFTWSNDHSANTFDLIDLDQLTFISTAGTLFSLNVGLGALGNGGVRANILNTGKFEITEENTVRFEVDAVANAVNIVNSLFSVQETVGSTSFTVSKFNGRTDISEPTEMNLQIASSDIATLTSSGIAMASGKSISNVNQIGLSILGNIIENDAGGMILSTPVNDDFTFQDGTTIFATLDVDGLFLNDSYVQYQRIAIPNDPGVNTQGRVFFNTVNNRLSFKRRNDGDTAFEVIDLEAGSGGGADQQLSNLIGTVTVNLDLDPVVTNAIDLGNATFRWKKMFINQIDLASGATFGFTSDVLPDIDSLRILGSASRSWLSVFTDRVNFTTSANSITTSSSNLRIESSNDIEFRIGAVAAGKVVSASEWDFETATLNGISGLGFEDGHVITANASNLTINVNTDDEVVMQQASTEFASLGKQIGDFRFIDTGLAGYGLSVGLDSSSPANADNLGSYSFKGRDSSNNYQSFAQISGFVLDTVSGSEDGGIDFDVISGSALTRILRMQSSNAGALQIGFFGVGAVSRPDITGSRGGNAALASLLTALANLGLITDSTT